ncbi:Type 1 membrane protein, putative isoform 1 [Hibiscus syriacus]|uniref:Type 1 membrane protein, putative isoform 1 n=2 Tax=Hibiscus syriacus TaxID=106335 RepID=A0A6A3C9T3_HIBSY|nr:Type 1 membrane protein, putative isoform 1 [Hibiscus syriacus]
MEVVKDPKHGRSTKKLQLMSKLMSLVIEQPTDASNTQPYGVSSPLSLPPFDSLPNSPPGLGPPEGSYGTVPSPPEFSTTPSTPQTTPTTTYIPSPSGSVFSPPFYEPSPPAGVMSPPVYIPSPIGFDPSPPVFLPPIVYPPPTVPPTPNVAPATALWCVAKPSVPDPIIQEAMNYACGTGADCDPIQPNGSCFHPDTLYAHASYAFNSYWQRTKSGGGTCEFGGTAILVVIDPSYDGCHFEYD